jgi:hypothetical protein
VPDVKDQPVADAPKAAPAKAKPKAAKGKGGKPGKTVKPKAAPKPESKYPEEVRAVAKFTREALPEGARSPGAKQVAAVVSAVGERPIAEAAQLSMAKIRGWALKGERPEDYAALRTLTAEVDDAWAVSKRLCVILVGLDDYRKDQKAATS